MCRCGDLRNFTDDRHRTVDDVAYGGGPGMVMKPAPIFAAVDAITRDRGAPSAVVLMTPQGRRFTHAEAERLSRLDRLVVICGRYEGVDERVAEALVTDELSIGDYVLTGGELPALVVIDAVVRLVPGVVGDAASVAEDSFVRGLLDCPHYTRPAVFHGLRGAGRAAVRAPCGDRAVAPAGTRAPDGGTAAGVDRARRAGRRRAARTGALARGVRRVQRRTVMKAIEMIEQAHLVEAAGDAVRRHRARPREGARGRQGAHPDLRGDGHRDAPRRIARVVHRAQGVVRPGRRAHLPAALADGRQDRSRARRPASGAPS